MEFRILGPMEVLDGSRLLDLPAGRGRALLAMLLLHAGEVVSADRLIDELWTGRPPATAGTVVQGLVSRLRRLLEPRRRQGETPRLLQTVGNGYRLVVHPDAVDASRFQRMVADTQDRETAVRAKTLGEALRLWRGPALADFSYEPFAQSTIAVLEELRLTATQEWITARLGLELDLGIIGELESLVADHPLREGLRALQMLALYRAGRQADALEVYRRTRELLIEELGVEPGAELRGLEAAVLRQDPSLDAPPAARESRHDPGTDGWLPRERRLVTVVGVDLSPICAPSSDPEALARAGSAATAVATEVLDRYGARVEQLMGHRLVAFFGFPIAHEDDALRATHAALEVRDAVGLLHDRDLAALGIRCTSRTTVESGGIVVTASGGSIAEMVSGQAVDEAFRLQRDARDDEVVVGPRAQRLVSGAVVLDRIPGSDDSWRAVEALQHAQVASRRTAALVGRGNELSRLRAAYRRTIRSGRPVRATLVGEAGVGKSRLAEELVASLGGDAQVVAGRCASFGQGLTFLPLREALSGLGPLVSLVSQEDAEQLDAVMGLGPAPGNVHAMVPALARLFVALTAEHALVLLLDDLHWAEPALLDVVDRLLETGNGPVLLLCLGRPELLEERPAWTVDAVVLGPLTSPETAELVRSLPGPSDEAVAQQVVERSQGNPLYVEQLLAAIDEQSLDVIPASLQGMLGSRLDRLGPGQRDLLRCAAVIGTECPREGLVALLPEEALPYVDRHLEALRLKRLVTLGDGGRIRFVHVLVQLAAYASMARDDRARIHEVYGAWLARQERRTTHDELVGYHLEQAVVNRRATGTPEPELKALAELAGARLAAAGARALTCLDEAAAQNLLARARAMLPPGDPARASTTQDLAEVDLVLGRFTEAKELLVDLAKTSARAGDDAAAWSARLEHARVQYIVGPEPLAAVARVAEDARTYFRAQHDDAGQGRAEFLLGCVYERQGRLTLSEQAFRTSQSFADRVPNMRERMASRWMIAEVLTAGPTPVDECLEQLDGLAMPGVEHPGIRLHQGILWAMQGRYDEARALLERTRTLVVERMHAPRLVLFVAMASGSVELLARDHQTAERHLREALSMAGQSGEPEHLAPTASRLSLLLRADGRLPEAERLAQLAADGAHAEDAAAQALARTAGSLLALTRGDVAAALRLADEAATWAPAEMPNLRGDVLSHLVEVFDAARRAGRAGQLADEAARLYLSKGNLARAGDHGRS
jgi:DNA-binding SARP family transcriptional activator/tetratricopeptide (TPR) repeat protein